MSAHIAPEQEGGKTADLADGPGRHLRVARQAQGLALGQVADELHLSATVIESLEHEDYGALPGQVFVVGYIRKYARLLGLDPEPLLASYHTAAPRTEPMRPAHPPRAVRQVGSGHLLVRIVSIGILILLAALTYLWWQGQQKGTEEELADSTLDRETETMDRAEAVPEALAPVPAPTMDPMDVAELEQPAETESDTQPPKPEPVPEMVATEPQPRVDAATETVTQGFEAETLGEGTSPTAGAEATRRQDTEDSTSLAEGNEEADIGEAPEIVVSFDGPCWVDVRDSERKYKLFGEMKKGDRHVLEGTPPYSVILGNAAAVQITVGGTAFDIGAFSRGNVARFILDPDTRP